MGTLETLMQEVRDLRREQAALRAVVDAYVAGQPEWLPTAAALRLAGIGCRESLVKYHRASRPEAAEAGRITYRKVGRRCEYLKSSCIDHAQRKLGQPALAA